MNRFIRFQYNEKVLPHINDYKNLEVSSLDSVLQPILCQIDQLDHYIKRAKTLRHYPSEHDLTEDESAAIYLYTDDWSDQSLNRILNQTLQSNDRTTLTPWLGFLKLFNTALEKLPTIKTTIWRGLPIDTIEKLKDNEELVFYGVTSCSSSVDIIKHFLNDNSVLCSIESLNGKYVHGYTPHENDYEVLLLPGTRLRVKSHGLNNGEHTSVICLEEISEINNRHIVSNHIDIPNVNKSTITTTKEPAIKAVITFSNGDRYKLAYQNGKKQDHGKYYSINGEKFEGQDADDRANGDGICAFKNGDRFVGTFKQGNRHGHGILYNVSGLIQVDNWANDEPTNQSLRIISSSNQYEWMNENDKTRCYGLYFDTKGNKYIGNIVDGKADGLGIRIWNDDSRYEGNFKDNKKHGFGIYYYADRHKYRGQWINDEINGEGKLKWNSGTRYKGKFTNGKRHGQGKLIFSNGKIQEGNWQENEYVG